MKPWDGIIPDEEQKAYRAVGFGRPTGVGVRPALLIIDVQYRTVGTEPRPFWEAIKEFPTSCGQVAWNAIYNIERLLSLFRARGWPVLYPYVAPKEKFDLGRLAEKTPSIMTIPEKGYQFPPEVAPRPGDVRDSQASIEAAKNILGYKVVVDFDEGLRRTVEWYRRQ